MRRRPILAVVVALTAAGCSQGSETLVQDTLPRIPTESTTTTTSAATTTVVPTTSIVPITAAATTVTVVTTAPAPTVPATTATTVPATTTTLAPTLTPPECSAAALTAAFGGQHQEPFCRAGWAGEQTDCLDPNSPCTGDSAAFYRMTAGGWVSEGLRYIGCDGELRQMGMPAAVTVDFSYAPCPDQPDPPRVIRPGDTGPTVIGVQTALVSFGYAIEVDGRFGPATEAAVRNFQAAHGLDADGLVGPATQSALFG